MKTSMKIPQEKTEEENHRTANAMTRRRKTKNKINNVTTLDRNLTIKQHEPQPRSGIR